MAVTKTVLKLNHMEALVKFTADAAGSQVLYLASDLLKSNEDLSGETPIVYLGAMENSCANGGSILVTRNGTLIVNMFENTEGFELPWGADVQNAESDIAVTFTGAGTVYMRLLKVKGYRPKFRPEQGVNV